MSSSGQHTVITVPDDCSEEEDEGCGRAGQPMGASVPPLLLSMSPPLASQKSSAAAMTDDDSGLPSSTKTGLRNSFSDDTDTSDMEGKGAFDYFPTRTRAKREAVSIHHTYNPHYDEEIAVDSDKSSIESPRSDTSSTREYEVTQLDSEDLASSVGGGGTEMTTYRLESCGYNDEDSDDNIHRRLYGRTTSSSTTTSSKWESLERPRASSTSSINFSRSQPLLSQGQPISSLRGSPHSGALGRSVDDAVHFSSLNSKSSESRYSPDCIGALKPPFTPNKDLLRQVGNSVSQLVSTSYNLGQSSPGDGMTPDGKKKKKKKKDGKDESSGNVSKPMTDLNGNPVDYRSMRTLPGSNESSSLITSRGSGSYGTTNHNDTSSGRGGLHDSLGMAKSEDSSAPSGAGTGPGDKRKNKKQRKPELTTRSEDIDNFVGDIQNIDQLVSFINSDITEKKLKKIVKGGNSASPASAVSGLPVLATKNPKKGKDRSKTKYSLTSSIGDPYDISLTPALETQPALSLPADSSATPTPSSSLLGSVEGNLSPERVSESRNSQSLGLDGEEPAGEMGNSSTSEKSGGEEDRTPDKPGQLVQQPVFKNHRYVSEKEVASAVSSSSEKPSAEVTKTDTNKNHKNHTFPNAVKADAVAKEQPADVKDVKDKGKTKNAVKEGGKTPDNNSSKKAKTKAPKNEVGKSETASEGSVSISRSHSAEGKGKEEVESEKDLNEDSEKETVSSPTALVPKTPDNIGLAMESPNFIFTDVDLPHSEPEFTVVSKKKKRTPLQVSNHGQNNSPSYGYHYSRDAQHQSSSQNFVPYQRNGPRSEFQYRPPPTKVRSCTPPPYSAAPEVVDKSRDLSPSAFPTLRKSARTVTKSKQMGTGGRRRSLEESTLGQLIGYDSDKESVKSLPAAQGGGIRGAFPVSYATMAATPHPSVDSSKAESVSSSTEGGGSSEWQSPKVWKGREGHERRHSIGSSPEDLAKASGSNLQGVRQRSGSQEMLSREAAKDPADRDTGIGLPGGKGMCQSESAGSVADTASAGSDVDSARGGSEAGSDPSDVFLPSTVTPATVAVESKKSSVVVPGNKTNTIPGAMPNAPPQTATTATSQGQAGVVRTAANTVNSGGVKSKCQQQAAGVRSQPPSLPNSAITHSTDLPNKASLQGAKPVTNGRKPRSVIFLDKRFEEKPPLDITFGFDMGDPPSVSVTEGMIPPVKDSSLGGETAITAQILPALSSAASVSSVTDSASCSSISSPHLQQQQQQQPSQPATSKTTYFSEPASGSDSNQFSKPAKGPHIAGLNGVVQPQRTEEKPAAAGPTPATVRSTVTATTSATSLASIVLSQTSSVSSGAQVPVGPAPAAPVVISEALSSKPAIEKAGLEAPPAVGDQPLGVLPDGCIALKLGEGLMQGQANGKSRQIMFRMHKGMEAIGNFNFAEAANFFQREWNKLEKLKEKDPAAVMVYSGE